jgi:hypothetical protein
MTYQVSLLRRVGMAKALGFGVGVIAFLVLPSLWPDADIWFRLGFLFWYTTFGVCIGVFGVMDVHPLLKFPMPPWFRGILLGGWLNLVLTFLIYDKLWAIVQNPAWPVDAFRHPLWFVVEGVVLGVLIDVVATWFGGEGRNLV